MSVRYNISGFDGSLDGTDPVKTKHGYFLGEDLSTLDTSFFSMTKSELEKCDPQQRQLLEVTRECLEDAGETNYRGQNVGSYIGTFGHDWMEMSLREPQHTRSYNVLGYSDMMLANRVSYEFDLRGPTVVVKTACSASLVALHTACRALQAGDITGAVVGGTSLILAPTLTSNFFTEGILSPEASCKTFDAKADGFARAEGITAIYVKRLSDAVRDGNPIRAVIRGSGTNGDGRSMGIMSPSSEAHEALMRQVYERSGLDPNETAFVECHGTGTPTGDPIELKAVGNIFGARGVYIGSVKPNVGHSEGCSGITSLIKGVLALEHGTIPPNIKFQTPNPKIPFAEKKLVVPVEPTPIPSDRAHRISINSFGIGGSNAHFKVIIESLAQYHGHRQLVEPGLQITDGDTHEESAKQQLLLFSANSQNSLKQQLDIYKTYTSEHPEAIPDIGYTLAFHREKLPHRAFAICSNGEMTTTSTVTKAPASPPVVTMIFSGQGSQWPGMGKQLIATSPTFRDSLTAMDGILQGLKNPPSWSIVEEIQKPAELSQINRAELAQPLCTALQIALYHELERLQIRPAAVVGHSSGEIAAAYAAGHINLEYAITAAYYRGYVTKNAGSSGGAMAAVGLSAAAVSRFLRPGSCVACENSPSSTTISGDRSVIEEVLASLKAEMPNTFARLLKVDMAYHSHHMKSLGEVYLQHLEAENNMVIPSQAEKAKFFSSVTCDEINESSSFSPQYWVDNLTSPVKFNTAVTNLLKSKDTENSIFLEVGPHSTLAGPLREIAAASSKSCNYTTSQVRDQDGASCLLSAVGRMYQEAVPVDLKPLFPGVNRAVSGLPTYPWDHSGSFWYESRLSSSWRNRRYPHHCLLGARSVESPDFAPIWRNMLNLEDVPWIADHKVREDVVFPLAGYVAMAGEAVRQITGAEAGYRLRRVGASKALVLPESKPVEVVTVLHPHKEAGSEGKTTTWYDFSVASCHGDSWLVHCEGEVAPLDEPGAPTWNAEGAADLPRKLSIQRFYEAMSRMGVIFGPEFRRLTDVTASATDPLAEAQVVSSASQTANTAFVLHPAAIDACIQLLFVSGARGLCRNLDQLQIPVFVEAMEISGGSASMRARAQDFTKGVECVTGDGKLAVHMSGLRLAPLESEAPLVDVHAGARLQWLPDFDFFDVTKLIGKPCRSREEISLEEHLTLLCVLESADKVAGIEPCQGHFGKYREWLALQTRMAENGEYALVDTDKEYVRMPRPQRQKLIDEIYAKILQLPGKHALSIALKRICDNAQAIFTGERDTLDLLMQDDTLTEIYNAVSFGYSDFVRLLSNSRPNLRILEVGAGTGGTTELILRDIVDENGLPPYSTYTFTDVSAGFFPQAKERFAYAPNMEYKTFDISQDGLGQGFEASSYDLILAPNVVHATASLKETLSNLQPLLKPDGFLVLTELCSLIKAPNFIFGNFIGWWLGEADGRNWEPYVQPEQWDVDLKAAGFTGVEAAVTDQDVPYRLAATIIARPQRGAGVQGGDRAVTLLCLDPESSVTKKIGSYLRNEGWNIETCKLGEQQPPKGRDIIASVGLESYFFDEDMTEAKFTAFQGLLRSLQEEKVLWLTSPIQVNCKDPRSAQTLGVARTARTELSLPLFTLEVDADEPRLEGLVCDVFNKIRAKPDEAVLHADKEFVVIDGVTCVGRYHPFDLKKEVSALTADGASVEKPRGVSFDPEATYILIGGTGGLGRSIATWMVEHGATDLTFLSRHAGTDKTSKALFSELQAMGCSVHAVAGSVESTTDVKKAISVSNKPVKGVFHLAMVLKDAPLVDMKYSDWVDVVRPKVNGAWHLHNALRDHQLDYFWLASSILTAVDQPGQGNYLATGTFLEAFCQYRHSLGLPASVLNICPVEGVGFVAENPQAKNSMKAQGICSLGEREFLDFLELNLLDSKPATSSGDGTQDDPSATLPKPWANKSQVLMGLRSEGDLDDPHSRTSWRHNRRMGLYHNVRAGVKEQVSDSSALKTFLAQAREAAGDSEGEGILERKESVDFLALEIGKKIHDFMLKPDEEVDTSLTLGQIGLDSLMAIELRRWTKQALGLNMSVLEIMGSGSLRDLGGMVAAKLNEEIRGKTE
ncbi:hypothetical protein VMCG_07466 [Cytospora schulzeri]|uniref:Uncharacterized protein n=1 Tax=Cytospora schulzeri TaxID=448051 RepID=A0A423W1H1_9PEZI|nr:hypothetical protein VMCG_07466 [Valsa malicola]